MNETQTTAYALNEMHGIERDAFESDLASDMKLQRKLQATSRVADALEQVMTEPGEGLEPQAREKLLLAMAANQKTFRARRKIVRFAIPVSLAAAASIAVLFLVTGEKTKQEPAMAAATLRNETPIGERVFIRSDSAKIASDHGGDVDRATNVPLPEKRIMPWNAKTLGAGAEHAP
ncbi:MAG: hypothetical protein JHD33_06815 [Chthoniobacterales bacterium]|nr:hypothetical protein [Chthoniobacterales bacterium]